MLFSTEEGSVRPASPLMRGSSGYSSAAMPATENFASPLRISASCLSSVSNRTVSPGSLRTMSPNRRAPITTLPFSATCASISVVMPI